MSKKEKKTKVEPVSEIEVSIVKLDAGFILTETKSGKQNGISEGENVAELITEQLKQKLKSELGKRKTGDKIFLQITILKPVEDGTTSEITTQT